MFAFIQEYILIMCAAIAALCTECFGVGVCLMLIALAIDLKNVVHFINKISKTHPNQCKMIIQFNKFIQFHSEVTQLSKKHKLKLKSIFIVIFLSFEDLPINFQKHFNQLLSIYFQWVLD